MTDVKPQPRRTNRVYKSLHKPLTYLGIERGLFYLVSDADFFSNHEFHQQMEKISQLLRAPALGGAQYGTHWRYERARGTYLNEQAKLTKAQRNLFKLQNPPKQLITKVDLAKYENR